jgi:hypothetical protein
MSALTLLTALRAYASSGSFQAFGYIRTPSGEPITNVDVIGDDYVGDLYIFKSDTNGYYSVDFDSDGNYKVYPSCPQLTARGYACPNFVSISIADGAVNVDFTVHPMPLTVTNASLPRGNVGKAYNAQLAAAGGQSPYTWQLATDSTNLPAGLSLDPNGHISGTPTAHTNATIKFQVTDGALSVTNKVLSLTVNPQPYLNPILWATNRFSMTLVGGSNQNYTLQTSTNLSSTNWTSLFVTSNRFSNSFTITDTNATNIQRLYRVLIGP